MRAIREATSEQLSNISAVNTSIGEATRINKNNVRVFGDLLTASNSLNEEGTTLLKTLGGFDLGIREEGTAEEAMHMVQRAVEFLETHGPDALVQDVNKFGAGRFIERDLYLMVMNIDNYRIIAHGVNPRVVDYDGRRSKDADGREYLTELVELARRQNEFWFEYNFNHPLTNEVRPKTSFVRRVGNLAISCGAYKG
jgi:hypothetical protein